MNHVAPVEGAKLVNIRGEAVRRYTKSETIIDKCEHKMSLDPFCLIWNDNYDLYLNLLKLNLLREQFSFRRELITPF